MHGANILPKPARFGCTAAICCQEGALFPSEAPSGTHEAKKPPRIAARERTAAISCHGRQPENTSRRDLATVGRRGNAFRERSAIDERPKKAPRRNIATVSHSRMHYSYILPMKSPAAARKYSMLVSRHAASVPPSGTGGAVVGAASDIGGASANTPNHGAGASAAGGGCQLRARHSATGRASAARPHGHETAAAHGRGLSAASWTTDSGTICCEPPFNRKNKPCRKQE